MRSRALLNLVLLLAVAALSVLLVLHPGSKPPPPPPPPVSKLEPGDAMHVTIAVPGKPEIRLQHVNGIWRIVAPVRLRASGFRVRLLLAVVHAPSPAGFRAAGNNLASFGLEPPLASLTVDGQRFDMGDTEPINGRRYVLYEGQVNIVDYPGFRFLRAGVPALVDPALLPPSAQLESLDLPDRHLTRAPGHWTEKPTRSGVTVDDLVALVERWRHASALAVEAWPPPRPADWKPLGEVRIVYRTGSARHTLVLQALRGKTGLLLARKDAGVAYHFTPEAGKKLLP